MEAGGGIFFIIIGCTSGRQKQGLLVFAVIHMREFRVVVSVSVQEASEQKRRSTVQRRGSS